MSTLTLHLDPAGSYLQNARAKITLMVKKSADSDYQVSHEISATNPTLVIPKGWYSIDLNAKSTRGSANTFACSRISPGDVKGSCYYIKVSDDSECHTPSFRLIPLEESA